MMMTQKEFNIFLTNTSNAIKPINQLLYQSIILIIFYYIFNSISFRHINTHISFIYLIFIICIILDWFIWNNCYQTLLFISILYIYIYYNLNKSNTISTFISIVNESRDITKQNNINMNIALNNAKDRQTEESMIQEQLDMITFVPKDITINYIPEPYVKDGINDLNSAYSSGIPSISITDSKFADDQLNQLYGAPQYKNIQKLDCKMDYYHDKGDKGDKGDRGDKGDKGDMGDKDNNINLFKTPKREFLDNRWLSLRENTYNDNCKTCHSSWENNKTGVKNKNAICSVGKYGQELEECTNQVNNVNGKQLDSISNNKVMPIYKF